MNRKTTVSLATARFACRTPRRNPETCPCSICQVPPLPTQWPREANHRLPLFQTIPPRNCTDSTFHRIGLSYLLPSYSSSLLPRQPVPRPPPPRGKKEWRAFTTHVLCEVRPSTLRKHEIEDTPHDDTRRILHIRLSLKIGRFHTKPNTQDCVRLAGLGWVSASPPPPSPMCSRESKVLPLRMTIKSRIEVSPHFSHSLQSAFSRWRICVQHASLKDPCGLSTATRQRHTPLSENSRELYHIRRLPRN